MRKLKIAGNSIFMPLYMCIYIYIYIYLFIYLFIYLYLYILFIRLISSHVLPFCLVFVLVSSPQPPPFFFIFYFFYPSSAPSLKRLYQTLSLLIHAIPILYFFPFLHPYFSLQQLLVSEKSFPPVRSNSSCGISFHMVATAVRYPAFFLQPRSHREEIAVPTRYCHITNLKKNSNGKLYRYKNYTSVTSIKLYGRNNLCYNNRPARAKWLLHSVCVTCVERVFIYCCGSECSHRVRFIYIYIYIYIYLCGFVVLYLVSVMKG